MNKNLFTVVIPAHNEEKYIGKCLRSIKTAAKYVAPRIFTGKDRDAADRFYYDVR